MVCDLYSVFRQIILNVKHCLLFTQANTGSLLTQTKHCTSAVSSQTWHPFDDKYRNNKPLK